MPGQRIPVLDWPYVEGLRMDEAMHPLTILAVGLYGKALPNQNGAPLRLVVPWKYGFKSIKSIVKIRFTEQQPPTSWNIVRAAGVRLLRQRESRPSTIPAGARRGSAASAAACSRRRYRRCRSTATANRSPGCTRAWT